MLTCNMLKMLLFRLSRLDQTGGLLSDVFLHLIPHAFMGEYQGSGVHFVIVEEKRNILIGWVAKIVYPISRNG